MACVSLVLVRRPGANPCGPGRRRRALNLTVTSIFFLFRNPYDQMTDYRTWGMATCWML